MAHLDYTTDKHNEADAWIRGTYNLCPDAERYGLSILGHLTVGEPRPPFPRGLTLKACKRIEQEVRGLLRG